GDDGDDGEGAGGEPGAGGGRLPRARESGDAADEGDEGGGDGEGEVGGGDGGGQGGDGPAPQPEPDPEPPVAPAELAVPSELKLKPGVYTGSFTVANLGGASLDWKAWPDPGVTVTVTEGTLAGGQEVVVGVTVDKSQLETGPFTRKVMVDAPGVGARDLWISGSRTIDSLTWCAPGSC
ncbi:MAG: hypothetical protein ACRD03_12870, partial [Acidimicrobiales bacterium]